MAGCHGHITNFGPTLQEINEAVKDNMLLSMEIEFSRRCNFSCPYCYVPKDSFFENELSRNEICDVIMQAKALGVKKIVILGGEPMVYPHILEMIDFIRTQDLTIEMFTNGNHITAHVAKKLLDHKVKVVLKMNSFNENIQDTLTGKQGSFTIIHDALHNLEEAGYPSEEALLAVSTIICRQNIDELAQMWQWLRERNIIPYFEMITPQANAKKNEWLHVESPELHDFFLKIRDLDHTLYNQVWEPQPPLIGNKCLRHLYSCLVTSQGYVMPCVGVTIPVGSIREKKLSDILNDSEVIKDIKNFRHTLKGPCRTCEKADSCYGCRGAAYQITGDYLASDPLCWRNSNRQEEIFHLPIAVDGIIPQKSPMRVVDTLVKIAEGSVEALVTILEDMPFVGEEGIIDDVMYFEMMAQALAAHNGFKQLSLSNSMTEGLLLGAKKLEILGKAYVGDTLKILVTKYAHYGDFYIVKGTVSRDNTVLAQGEIKIWQNSGTNRELK